jgi:hypothetical protein
MRFAGWTWLGAVIVLLGACGSDSSVTAMFVESDYGVPVVEARDVHLLTTCADDVNANVSETDEAVRITDIEGDSLGSGPDHPDCQGGVTLSLSEPIGERALVVDGETWRLQAGTDCPDKRFAPPDANGRPGCRTVP